MRIRTFTVSVVPDVSVPRVFRSPSSVLKVTRRFWRISRSGSKLLFRKLPSMKGLIFSVVLIPQIVNTLRVVLNLARIWLRCSIIFVYLLQSKLNWTMLLSPDFFNSLFSLAGVLPGIVWLMNSVFSPFLGFSPVLLPSHLSVWCRPFFPWRLLFSFFWRSLTGRYLIGRVLNDLLVDVARGVFMRSEKRKKDWKKAKIFLSHLIITQK